jgi:hypothetical protein
VLLVVLEMLPTSAKSVATVQESVLDVSSLKAKSGREGNRREWLIRPSQLWFTIRGKPLTSY